MELIDYLSMARSYNLLEKGKLIRLPKVSNVTQVKRAISRRGVEEGTDFMAFNRGKFFYLRRVSEKKMNLKQ